MPLSQVIECPNKGCSRPFFAHQYDLVLETALERGKIICPHCGLSLSGSSEKLFLTHALTDREEAHYEAGKENATVPDIGAPGASQALPRMTTL